MTKRASMSNAAAEKLGVLKASASKWNERFPKELKLPLVDAVDHPPHYKSASGLEAIDVIEGFALDFQLGNCVKYILRAGKKNDAVEDLRKAQWYLNRAISNRTSR